MKLILTENGAELVHPSGNWKLKREIGFSPVETTVSAVAACSAYVYIEILNNSKIDFEIIDIDVDYKRSETIKTFPISEVIVTFHMKVPKDMQGKAERATAMIARNCPVVQSLNPDIWIHEDVIFVD